MSRGGHRAQQPEVSKCRLCGDLAQVTVHFDADWWESAKASAEERIAEARAEISEAEKHLRMLATPPPPGSR
jgi:hypothetical protein